MNIPTKLLNLKKTQLQNLNNSIPLNQDVPSDNITPVKSEEYVSILNDIDPSTPPNIHKPIEQQLHENKQLKRKIKIQELYGVGQQNSMEPGTSSERSEPAIDLAEAIEKTYHMYSNKNTIITKGNIYSLIKIAHFFDCNGNYELSNKIDNLLKKIIK